MKKEVKKFPLTDFISSRKEPKKIPLISTPYDIEMVEDIWSKDENNNKNNSESVQQLESHKIN